MKSHDKFQNLENQIWFFTRALLYDFYLQFSINEPKQLCHIIFCGTIAQKMTFQESK